MVERLSLTSLEESKKFVNTLPTEKQEKYVRQLFLLMYLSGYDDASHWNFAFIKEGPHQNMLAIYDTEPLDLIQLQNTRPSGSEKLGVFRDIIRVSGLSGISKAMHPDKGLVFFDHSLLEKVNKEFLEQGNQEKIRNETARKAIQAFSYATIITILTACYLFNQISSPAYSDNE